MCAPPVRLVTARDVSVDVCHCNLSGSADGLDTGESGIKRTETKNVILKLDFLRSGREEDSNQGSPARLPACGLSKERGMGRRGLAGATGLQVYLSLPIGAGFS
jgi:hypothetical protein